MSASRSSSRVSVGRTLAEVNTPALVLDAARLERNVARMRARLGEARADVRLRPHLKTAKSIDVARLVMDWAEGPITVSTLREAEYFAEHGVRDILYAVGIAPAKLPRVLALRRGGVDLAVVTDNVAAAEAIGRAAREAGDAIPVLIEIDCEGHRSGIRHDDEALLLEVARAIEGGARVRGVMTHAGGSYDARTVAEVAAAAADERGRTLHAARILRASGFAAPDVSIGSTPTALAARDLTGVTEVRAGVFTFFDLVMVGLGACAIDEIALSVLATVIGHQRDKGWIIVDAGWMALSRDRGTAAHAIDQGYGVVCDLNGEPYRDLLVVGANQEHGIVAVRAGSDAQAPDIAVGATVRILPNHACATAAQHGEYLVVRGTDPAVTARWPRVNGW